MAAVQTASTATSEAAKAKEGTERRSPDDFLKSAIGRPIVVKLNTGTEFRGILTCMDGFMNVVLEQAEEYANGELQAKYGDAFVRGNNVLYISRRT